MLTLLELQDQRNHKRLSIQEVLDRAEKSNPPRPMTAEEVGVFDGLKKDIDGLDAQIAQVAEHERRRREFTDLQDRLDKPAGRVTQPEAPANGAGGSAVSVPATFYRHSALKAFKGQGADHKAYRMGMWALAVLHKNARAQHYCQNQGIIQNALATNDNAAGGFLVPEEFSTAIIDLREMYGVFRANARVRPMASDTMLIPRRASGVTVYFVGEGVAITPSDPAWNQVRLVAKKLAGMTLMSSEIDEDAVVDLGDYLAAEFAYALALKEDQCGFNGDGTSTYGGITGLTQLLKASGGLAGAVDAASGHDTFAEIDAADLSSVMGKLPAYARPRAKWYVSSTGFDVMFGRLMIGAGGNTMQNIQGGYQPMYLGHPVVITQVLPTATTDLSDLVMILFGDLALSSSLGSRRGIRVQVSDERYFDTDQIAVKVTERIDIVNHDVGDTTTPGPVVALVGE